MNSSSHAPDWKSYCLTSPTRLRNHSPQLLLNPAELPQIIQRAKLPKLDVPAFDGNLIHWKQFWEQFTVSMHNRSNLSTTEKIIYLKYAIKDGSVKNAIKGLSHSCDNYDKVVECLKARYDRSRLIHRTHVEMITFQILPVRHSWKCINVTAVVVPKVTCDVHAPLSGSLPLAVETHIRASISWPWFWPTWSHRYAAWTFVDMPCHGWRKGRSPLKQGLVGYLVVALDLPPP